MTPLVKFRIKEFGDPSARRFIIEAGEVRHIFGHPYHHYRTISGRYPFRTLSEAKAALKEIVARYEKAEEFRKKCEPTCHYL